MGMNNGFNLYDHLDAKVKQMHKKHTSTSLDRKKMFINIIQKTFIHFITY